MDLTAYTVTSGMRPACTPAWVAGRIRVLTGMDELRSTGGLVSVRSVRPGLVISRWGGWGEGSSYRIATFS